MVELGQSQLIEPRKKQDSPLAEHYYLQPGLLASAVPRIRFPFCLDHSGALVFQQAPCLDLLAKHRLEAVVVEVEEKDQLDLTEARQFRDPNEEHAPDHSNPSPFLVRQPVEKDSSSYSEEDPILIAKSKAAS